MALTIDRIVAWEALDSRGTPTVGCAVRLAGGAEGEATVPSGASTGSHEAHERRDGGQRYGGKGVRAAVAALRDEVVPLLRGRDAGDQQGLDAALRELDGTDDLSRLGANAVLAASIACARAAAAGQGLPLWQALSGDGPPLLPMPMVNILSGGAHAGGMIDIQDVLVVPLGATSFAEAIEWAARVRSATAEVLRERRHPTALIADEGGLAASFEANREALDAVATGIERSGLGLGTDAALALDIAATGLLQGNAYTFPLDGRMLAADQMVEFLITWIERFPIVSLEDPLAEDDAEGWRIATQRLAGHLQLVGDDLFATSPERVARGIADGVANAVLVKPNQVGTLSDAGRVVDLARAAGYGTILSARSGDTEDAWLADLAVGWRAGQIKVGSTMRSERTAKWNRLLRIEAERPDAVFAGRAALAPGSLAL